MKIKYLFIICILGAVLWAGNARIAQAEEPERIPYRPQSVTDQTHQMAEDSATLLRVAREQQYKSSIVKDETITNMELLHAAAGRLDQELGRLSIAPSGTVDSYLRLREAYDQARPSFDVLEDTGAVRTAVWRIRDTIRDVTRFYYNEVVVPLQNQMPPPPPPVDWKLRQTAADIARLSAHLAAEARELQLIGQVGKRTAERFFELGDSAHRFYDKVISSGYDPALLQRDCRDLIQHLQDARDVVGDFKMDFQQSLGSIWERAHQLESITPEMPLGEYRLYDFNH